MAVNDTVRLTVQGTADTQDHFHTLHFRYLDPTSNEQGLIDAWQAGCRTAYRNCFVTADAIVKVLEAAQVCGTIPLRAPVEEAEAAGSQNGTITGVGDRAPSWLAAVTSLRTASAGRSRRGRYFLGGLMENEIVGNDLSSGHKTTVEAYAAALMGVFGPSGTSNLYRLVVYSRKLASVPGTQCQDSSTVITSTLVNSAIGSMKSRKPGRGN